MKKPSTMLGLAIGDALGQPFEFSDTQKILATGWDGTFIPGMVWNLEPGKWTDDTKMALAIAESILEHKKFDGDRVALKYIDWVRTGDLRGIGVTCERAINKLSRGVSIKESSGIQSPERAQTSFRIRRSGEEVKDNRLTGSGDFCGNGTVMRCAPIGLYYHDDLAKLKEAAHVDATMTHDHPDARDSSFALCHYIAELANGLDKYSALGKVFDTPKDGVHVEQHLVSALEALDENLTIMDVSGKLGARGTAHETLASAVYCFLKYPTFEDAVISSILIGGDTDTRAAIVGSLAGTYYGLEGIPAKYVEDVEETKMLQDIDQKLYGKSIRKHL